ncbi:MAG: SLBB domain-containing protein [Eisenbergiella sp.]
MPIFHLIRKAPGTALFLVLLFVTVFLQGCGKDGETLFTSAAGSMESTEASGDAGGFEGTEAFVPEDTGGEKLPGAEGPLTAEESSEAEPVIVHICGAVKAPGVYELEQGSRVMDAVNAGGGFLPEAAQDSCNLAEPVTDGCQIYIMTNQESLEAEKTSGIRQTGRISGASAAVSGTGAGLVDLNTADKTALMTLPGIGESRADDILNGAVNTRFSGDRDIMKISVSRRL